MSVVSLVADNFSEGKNLFLHADANSQFSWAESEFEKAYPMLLAAAEEGYGEAAYMAAMIRLKNLDGQGYDADKAYELFLFAVENGYERGRVELGDYCMTLGDEELAFKYWSEALDYNERDALSKVFSAIWYGIGTDEDKQKAALMAKNNYEKIASSSDENGLSALGTLLLYPDLRDPKYNNNYDEEAAALFNKTENPYFMLVGADILIDGNKEYYKSRLLNKSSNTNQLITDVIRTADIPDSIRAKACLSYARFNDRLSKSFASDNSESLKWNYGITPGEALLWAADNYGDAESIELAALWYRLGVGLPKNLVKAKHYEALLDEKYPERANKGIIPAGMTVGEGEIVEQPAENAKFPGPDGAMSRWVAATLNDPGNQEGVVVVEFIIEQDGSISNIEVVKCTVSDDRKREALRVTRMLPQFIPAKDEKGNPVRSKMRYKYKFDLCWG
ncbi:MAG: TonB family protein [Muribaculaceae bacterium]|nr:TonB family protein [Muribaculaceae bacterium]